MPRTFATSLVIGLLAVAGLAPAAQAAPSSTAIALSGTNLLVFDPASPTVTTTVAITGVDANETLVGIDVRPQNGYLYGLGINATANTGTLYVINRRTGVSGVVGAAGGIAFVTTGGTPIDFPDPATTGWGFDFNPAVDRIRVTAGALNFRITPVNGAGVDLDNNGANGVNPDGAHNGATTTVDAAAYTNNRPNNGNVTTLYELDAASDALLRSTSPNNGTVTSVAAVTLGGSPLNFTAVSGFDIDPAVNAPSTNTAVSSGIGYATLNVGGTTALYSIDLVSGQATLIGNVGNGSTAVQGLALQRSFDDGGQPIVALMASGLNLVRFSSATPGTTTTVGTSAPTESLVAMAMRPQTGQYYALGINEPTDSGTLYLLDPQTGATTPVGVVGQIAFQTGAGTAIDLPSGSAGWGMDFNPTVDRVRITTTTGLNFRVNPNSGAPVDGNFNLTPPPANINPDGTINGLGVSGLAATSYTNAFTQPLTGGTTTQYTLDASSDRLLIQTPPNSGTQTAGLAVQTSAGTTLDFDATTGFDIAGDVSVEPFFLVGAGEGLAAMRVGGVTSLYRIDLQSGAATALGTISTGSTAMRSIVVGDVQRPKPAATRTPDALAFGARDIAKDPAETKTTTVTNTTSTPLELVALTAVGDGFTVSGGTCVASLTLQKDQSCSVDVTFQPTTAGAKSGTLTIDTNAPDLTVALTGTGTAAPVATPTPTPTPTATPTATPTPTPGVPAPSVRRVRKAKVSGKRLDTGLRLTCPAGRASACTGTVKVTRKVRGRTRTVGSAKFTVRAGKALTLAVTPSKANLRLLKNSRRLALRMTVSPKGSASRTFTTTLKKGRA